VDKTKDETKWELRSEGELNLVGTKICICYCGGNFPYHVHRGPACHAMEERLEPAKKAAIELVAELIEMGMDP